MQKPQHQEIQLLPRAIHWTYLAVSLLLIDEGILTHVLTINNLIKLLFSAVNRFAVLQDDESEDEEEQSTGIILFSLKLF